MAGIPDQSVFREIVDEMQCETEFNNTEVAGKMSRPFLHQIAQRLTNLFGQLNQLLIVQAAEIEG